MTVLRSHAIILDQITKALQMIFLQDAAADKAIEKMMQANRTWNDEERKIAAQTIYFLIKNWRLLWSLSGLPHEINHDNIALLLSFSAMIDPAFNFGPMISKESLAKEQQEQRWKSLQKNRAVRFSIPDWLDSFGSAELGSRWDSVISSLNQSATLTIRTNTLKTTPEKLSEIFRQAGIKLKMVREVIDALEITEYVNLFRLPAFKSGYFEVQDVSSQQVGLFLQAEPGQRVIDACAGQGGKTLHLAALMKNKGKIIALDNEAWKLDMLKKRAKRAGANIIETRFIENRKVIKRLKDSADRLLLDVPCSGTGVLRKKPDIKWRLNAETLTHLNQLQANILHDYSPMVKPGGIMVYSTCSILPSENEKQIQRFLIAHPEFILDNERHIFPDESPYDGFYMARLIKK